MFLIIQNNLSYQGIQRGEVGLNRFPDNLPVHPEITVNQPVTHACHISPWDFRIAFLKFTRDILCCFSDNFKRTNNCIGGPSIIHKLLERHTFNESTNIF